MQLRHNFSENDYVGKKYCFKIPFRLLTIIRCQKFQLIIYFITVVKIFGIAPSSVTVDLRIIHKFEKIIILQCSRTFIQINTNIQSLGA